jgi:uncharacterized protein DUF4234
MKNRKPIAVFLLGLVTLGIYSLYWAISTKGEMNRLGEKIPTAWILLIPFIGSFWWYWEYAKGVEHVTNQKLSWVMTFILLLILGNIGEAVVQDFFNKLQPAAAVTPTGSTQGPQIGMPTPTQPTVAPAATPVSPNPTLPNQQPPTSNPTNPPIVGG